MKQYTPNPRIVNRAVELWVEMLRKPSYDNGDSSMTGMFSKALAKQIPKNNDEETLERFGNELRAILMEPLEWEYKNSFNGEVRKHKTLFDNLHVDYAPDTPLSEAAKRSGLKMEFPWKTNMYLSGDRLSLSRGYGAPHEYHYPLSDGRWFVTTLNGDDIGKIIALVEAGHLTTELTIP